MHQPVYFVMMLAFMQHFTHVHCHLFNFEIADQIRNVVHKVLFPKQNQESVLTQYVSTPLPTVQHSTYGMPGSSEGVQPQVEASTLPQDSVNSTLQEVLEGRAMIDAPLIHGKCEAGYKMVNRRCRRMFGRRRRRR
jgi:hypothetical protein